MRGRIRIRRPGCHRRRTFWIHNGVGALEHLHWHQEADGCRWRWYRIGCGRIVIGFGVAQQIEHALRVGGDGHIVGAIADGRQWATESHDGVRAVLVAEMQCVVLGGVVERFGIAVGAEMAILVGGNKW